MDWANERYVRLFTRDTPEWLCMEWQGRALWPHLLRKADRSGVLANKLGARGIAVLVALPIEVVEVGIASLLADGCLREHPLGYLIPNFIEAQETPQSDAQRQRESRERRRGVTKRDTQSQNVTECHATSRDVTNGHAESRPVTPDQTRPDQPEDLSGLPDAPPEPGPRPPDRAVEIATIAVAEINRLSGKRFDPETKSTVADCKKIAKLKRTDADVLLVIRSKRDWLQKPDMRDHFCPATLLRPNNFEKYLDAARARQPALALVARQRSPDHDEPDFSYTPS